MPDKCERTLSSTLSTFLKCVAERDTEISKSNFGLRGLDWKCRCAATMLQKVYQSVHRKCVCLAILVPRTKKFTRRYRGPDFRYDLTDFSELSDRVWTYFWIVEKALSSSFLHVPKLYKNSQRTKSCGRSKKVVFFLAQNTDLRN